MRLVEFAERLGGSLAPLGGAGPKITGVHLDSRRVGAGDLFAAIGRSEAETTRNVADAVGRGAVAVLVSLEFTAAINALKLGVPVWSAADPRHTVGLAAALVYGEPARSMFKCAVTGTNGKTTTAHVLGHLLHVAGRRPAILGTAGNRLADGQLRAATHTTPDAPELQRLLAEHSRLGGNALAMEVSSHALDQDRTAGVEFDVAIFTNLTRDHLDYHGDLETYARAKERLFSGLSKDSVAIVNADEPASLRMAKSARRAGARVVTYSTRLEADLCASNVCTDLGGTEFILNGMGISRTRIRLPLTGRYNVENALAAAAAVLVSGASPSVLSDGLATASGAPGRLERVATEDRGFTLLVDYAHSEDALSNVCRTLRESLASARKIERGESGRLIVVFGCGGDRDKGKRAPMGRVVNELADLAIVTSDNPRSEDPERILNEIVLGMEPRGAERIVEVDRRRAIQAAVRSARRGDVVLIAGKGHETTQTIGGEVHEFDDRTVAREALR